MEEQKYISYSQEEGGSKFSKILIISIVIVIFMIVVVFAFIILSGLGKEKCKENQYLENRRCINYTCIKNIDCDDNNPNTRDNCLNPSTKKASCKNKIIVCDKCQYLENGTCKNYACCNNSDCDDNNETTIDSCVNPVTINAKCINIFQEQNITNITNQTQICGDNLCSSNETCSTCFEDCGLCPLPTPTIQVSYFTNISGNIRYGYITDKYVGVGGRESNTLGFFYLNGSYKTGVYFPQSGFTIIKGKGDVFAIGDNKFYGFEAYDTNGLQLFSVIPDNLTTSTIYVTNNLIAVGTNKFPCVNGSVYLFQYNDTATVYKYNYTVPGSVTSVYIDEDTIGITYSDIPSGPSCKKTFGGIVLLDYNGDLRWRKNYTYEFLNETGDPSPNLIRIVNNRVVIKNDGLKIYSKNGELLHSLSSKTHSFDANNKIIAVIAPRKLFIYNHSLDLLWNRDIIGNYLTLNDLTQLVSINSKTITVGSDKGLYVFDYNGNELLNYNISNKLVYSVHSSEQLIGAGFGDGGYHLFKIEEI